MRIRTVLPIILIALLAACGGGGGGDATGGGPATTQGASYQYVPPAQGQSGTYTTTVTDSSGNSATYSGIATVTQVNADGSSVTSWQYPGSSGNYTLDGFTYGNDPYLYNYDSKGQLIQSQDVAATADQVVCTYSYPGGGAPSSAVPGQSWNSSQAESCGGNDIGTFTETTTYLGIESLTVPAGTFSAYKLQTVDVSATASVPNLVVTNWYDTSATGSLLLKVTTQYADTGSTSSSEPNSSTDMELTSYQ